MYVEAWFVFRRVTYSLGLLMMLVGGRGLRAQSATDGAISGNVTDASGAAVAGANVTVKNNGTNLEQTAVRDESGYFRVGKRQPASYTVKVEAPGMAPYGAENVLVRVGFPGLSRERLAARSHLLVA